jgi:hypothetical protein
MAYETGQTCVEKKQYNAALACFHLAAAGSNNPGFAHYHRARVYAMSSHKKEMLAELRLALSTGYHEVSGLDVEEFQSYRGDDDFKGLSSEWKKGNANLG